MTGDRKPRVVADARQVSDDQPHVSPDGRWIAFNSNESGRWEVYLASFPHFSGSVKFPARVVFSRCGGLMAGNCSTLILAAT
jgi:hypothetical protein